MDHFQQELAGLKQMLLRMGSHAEAALQKSMLALANRDFDLAVQVIVADETLDRFEIEVDELSIRLLAMAPLGTDLRLITVTMKISQNLERVGDEATKIAKRARDLSQEAPLKISIALPEMAALAVRMLKGSLDAFVSGDAAAARALISQDKEVDQLNKQTHRQLASFMVDQPGSINGCLHLMVIAKSLERIADHAKNIAESAVYLCEAEDIRHQTHAPAS